MRPKTFDVEFKDNDGDMVKGYVAVTWDKAIALIQQRDIPLMFRRPSLIWDPSERKVAKFHRPS